MSPAVFARINPASSSVLKSTVASPFQTRFSALRIVDLRRWIQWFAREPEKNQDGQAQQGETKRRIPIDRNGSAALRLGVEFH